MTQLRYIVLMLVALAAATFLIVVGAGVVAVLSLVMFCAIAWYRIKRRFGIGAGRDATPAVPEVHVVDVEYEIVEDKTRSEDAARRGD